jgi:DNA-binding transcriptional regulator YiaG
MEWTPENIRRLRRHLSETQEQFAERMGVERRQTIHEWETGKRSPSGTARRLMDLVAEGSGFERLTYR